MSNPSIEKINAHHARTIKLSDDTVRFHQGAAAGARVWEAHQSVEFPDMETRLAMYWFYVGALAGGEYGCQEQDDFSAFILGAKVSLPAGSPDHITG